jgi:transcriptional regulator with XRE-family HTH domain
LTGGFQNGVVDDLRLGALVRAVRLKRGLRQRDVAEMAGVSHGLVSLVERGHCQSLSIATLRQIAAALDVRVDLVGRWRGGDADRLLSRGHSRLAERFARVARAHPGWTFEPEVSFSIYGERGIVDQLGWHEAAAHLLVVELKTEFTDVNEMMGTLDRKVRLARTIAESRGWRPAQVSAWVIVLDTRTNRRHAAEHDSLLRSKFPADGRQLESFLRNPIARTSGLRFMTDSNPSSTRHDRRA